MQEDYVNLSDEELISILREGDENVMEYLLNKYKNLVKQCAGKMFILGGDDQDLIQEGMIGLFKAVRDYDPGRDACFFTFAKLCISRNIFSAVSKSGRQKNYPLNYYISIYNEDNSDNREEESKNDTMISKELSMKNNQKNPESIVIDNENLNALEQFIEDELSEFEKQVLKLHITGLNYRDIAKILGREEKSTDNCLQRIKNKIKKFIDNKSDV